MNPDFFLFVFNFRLVAVPNMHDAQIVTSSFRSKILARRTPVFDSVYMDLGCR